MYCKNCGFITRGHETSCPYCGTKYEKEKFYDQRFIFCNWFETSIHTLVNIAATNLFLIFVILDLILYFVPSIKANYNLSFYGFVIIYGLVFIVNDLIFAKDYHRNFYFLKVYGYVIVASIIMMLSFPSWDATIKPAFDIFSLTGTSSFSISFGYVYPCLIIGLILVGTIRFIAYRNLNIFSSFFYVLILLCSSLIIFIMSFFDVLGFSDIQRILIYISFGLTIIVLLNCAIFFTLKFRTREVEK